MSSDQPSSACFTGKGYEFADGDVHERSGDTLAGFPAEFLTLFQLAQRLGAEELHTGARATDVAQMLNDLDRSMRWGTRKFADVCRRAGDVIRGLLRELSVSQLGSVAGRANGQKMEEAR